MFFLTLIFFVPFFLTNGENVTVSQFVQLINSRQSSWRAGRFTVKNTTEKSLFYLYKRLRIKRPEGVQTKPCNVYGLEIPESFDVRERWPECRDITGRIGNQGLCNSCWAFAATGVMSDRLCIQTGGKEKFDFSPQDLISCCKYCDSGCSIGMPIKAWKFYNQEGIVSGGGFSSFKGCKPYQESEFIYNKSSTCTKSCYNPDYDVPYDQDKHYGESYYMVDSRPECIQAEIMEYGPVQTMFAMHEDLPFYRDGVYSYTIGRFKNLHSVKIMGWGVESGVPYWLVTNSWGCSWGNLGGFFKVKMGNDECAIEQYVIAGNPKLTNLNSFYNTSTDSNSTSSSFHSNAFYNKWMAVGIILMLGIVFAVIAVALSVNRNARDVLFKYLRFK